MPEKNTIGLVENVTLFENDKKGSKKVKARIDTGATSNSIDAKIAAELKLGPVIKTTVVNSANGRSVRPVVNAHIKLAAKDMTGVFTLADRSKMRYRMLIGQDILKKAGFLIDPNKPASPRKTRSTAKKKPATSRKKANRSK